MIASKLKDLTNRPEPARATMMPRTSSDFTASRTEFLPIPS